MVKLLVRWVGVERGVVSGVERSEGRAKGVMATSSVKLRLLTTLKEAAENLQLLRLNRCGCGGCGVAKKGC